MRIVFDFAEKEELIIDGNTGAAEKSGVIAFDADPDGRIKEAPALLKDPSGYGAALAGLKYFIENGCDTSLFSEGRLAPIYLRKSQAEREKEERAEKK